MYMTNYSETGFLNVMRNVSFAAPAKLYLALFLSSPTESGTAGTEVSYSGYERQELVFNAPSAMLGGIGYSNSAEITFATAAVTLGTITHIGVYDSRTGGNMVMYGKLTDDLAIAAGEAPVIRQGEITYYMTGKLSAAYKTKILNWFRGTTLAGFNPYFALFNGNPESNGAELSGDNYARVAITFGAPAEQDNGQMLIKNSAQVSFNTPSTAWGTWTYSAIYDSAATGEPVWIDVKSPEKPLLRGYRPYAPIDNIRVLLN